MNKKVIILISLFFTSCGSISSNCTVQEFSSSSAYPTGGSLITCGLTQTIVSNGTNGANGSNGTNGLSIVATVTPDESGKCTAGGNVILMAQDSQGTGIWAPQDSDQTAVLVCNGTNGTNGVNGTLIEPIQFCPNYTTRYPSVFTEFGLCINNSFYAVYWDGKNSWLSLIPPGWSYISTSTSAPCTFTVGSNCKVSN